MRTIVSTLLIVISGFHSTQAEESRTFCGNTVEGWTRILRDRTSRGFDRRSAVWALGCFGPEAKAAVPDLIEEYRRGPLKNEVIDALVQIGAATEVTVPSLIERFLKEGCVHLTAAGAIGFNPHVKDSLVRIGGPAVPALRDVLTGANTEMQVCAAEALGEIGPAARAAIPSLVRAIRHPDDDRHAHALRRYAIQALGRIGPPARVALPVLNEQLVQDGIDFDLVMALDGIGAPPVKALLDSLLHDGDSDAAYQLAWLGPKAREAVPALRGALTDKRPQVRISAAVALAHVDSSTVEAIPVLIEALSRRNDETLDVYEVPRALAQFGPRAKAALPALIGIVEKEDRDYLETLVQIDPDGKEIVPTLITALKHEDYATVHVAADCLSLLGPKALDAVPALAAAVTRPFNTSFSNGYDPQVSAANALRRVGPRAHIAIPALIGALTYRHIVRPDADGIGPQHEERDSLAAAAAARVLGSFGAAAKVAVPALIEAVQAREEDGVNQSIRAAAILALGQIGPDAKAAITTLRNMLEDKRDSYLLPEIMVALYQLAPDGKELAEKWLAKPIRNPYGIRIGLGTVEGRAMVFGAMGRMNVETDWLTRSDLEQLDRFLAYSDPRDDEVVGFEWRLEKFARLGVAGRLAISRLTKLRKHPNPFVRMWATEALEQIVPPAGRPVGR